MLTKEDFETQIVDGIKAGRLDPCNGVEFGDIENFNEKDFGELSEDEVEQAMLDIIDEYGVDDWYDQYQEA